MKIIVKDGRTSCTCLNGHKSYGWRRSGFLLIIIGVCLFCAILLPYITAVARQALPAFLPFISQSGGSPPETGLLAVPLILLSFTGFFAFPAFFVSINQRNKLNSIWVRRLNLISLPIAIACFFGCIITAAFPVAFTEVPNQLEWVVTVLVEHSTGATMILGGIVVYQFLLTGIWWLLPDVTKISKFIRLGFSIAFLIIFAIVIQPTFAFIYEELGHKSFNAEELRNITSFSLPTVFSPSYKVLAFFEWAVCFMSLLNFLETYKDFQRISLHVTLRHKSCFMDVPEPTMLKLHSLA